MEQGTWRWAGTVAAMLLVGACVPHVDEVRVNDDRPIGSPHTVEEHQEAEPEIKASLADNTVTIKAWQRTECRSTTTTPVEKEEGVRRSLHNGALAQTVNLVTAGLLVAAGVVVYAAANGSCTTTPNSSATNPNPSPVPCTAAQQQQQSSTTQGLGIVTAGAAILPLGAFVWNLIRAQDDTRTETAPPSATSSEWKMCAAKPLANTPITLTAGGVTVTEKTDDRGEATLDASPIASAVSDPQNGTIKAYAGGKRASATVSLADSPMYVAWQKARAASGAAASTAAMDRARQNERGTESAALDNIEPDLAALERKPEPWGDVEIQRRDNSRRALIELLAHHEEGQAPPRLQQDAIRLDNLGPKYKRAIALAEQRQKQEAVEEARREAAAQKQLLPFCIKCCLVSFVGATRDHCETACGAYVGSYVAGGQCR